MKSPTSVKIANLVKEMFFTRLNYHIYSQHYNVKAKAFTISKKVFLCMYGLTTPENHITTTRGTAGKSHREKIITQKQMKVHVSDKICPIGGVVIPRVRQIVLIEKAARCLIWDAKGVSWMFRTLLGVLGDLAVNTNNVY